MTSPYILFFDEIDKDSLPLVGGKGTNLGDMTAAGFPVPGGYCVTTEAYWAFIEQNDIEGFIAQTLGGAALEGVAPENVSQIGARLREKLQQSTIPPAIAQELIAAWQKTASSNAYAVRSSATAEDLPFASFAGQQDTYLNIIGEGRCSSRCATAGRRCSPTGRSCTGCRMELTTRRSRCRWWCRG